VNLALGAWAAALLMSLAAAPAQRDSTEYGVKAAYLYQFGRYVTWPAAAVRSGTFHICVAGADPFGGRLDAAVDGASIEGRPVATRRVARPEDAQACRILFVSDSEQTNVAGILSALDRAAVVTVSDMPNFVQRGGMIQFVVDKGRVRFEVNLALMQEAGFSVSSDLLRVASAVRTGGR
jgi:hypothetical protein